MISRLIAAALLTVSLQASLADTATEVHSIDNVQPRQRDGLYPHNQAPLTPSPFMKLPIGSIRPEGWIRHMLELERDGMIGRLKEISPWLDFEKSSWADKDGAGKFGWEEMPYWLKGYGDLGYVLGDEKIVAETRQWLEAAMASQREDGWFGPRELLTSISGKADLWPNMVMLNCLQSYYEYKADPRVLEVMTRYFRWQSRLPESAFGEGYWPKLRMGDNIESCYWLYNRTREPWLLELATRMHRGMARWNEDVVNWHNVNIAQGFRAGTVYWMQSGLPQDRGSAERNYKKVMSIYGQFPGGGFVGDENSRPGYTDPRGGIETCGIVEFTHSFQMLTRITGDPVWADRCEEIAFNSFPAALTPDQKALHYITCANQVQLDRHNKAPGIQNSGTMFSYSPYEVYRCCQHNVSHGWPYYAEELWLATHDGGLCASLYGSSQVRAQVSGGQQVTIRQQTDYPFNSRINFLLNTKGTVEFPLYLRVPEWCRNPALRVNGKRAKLTRSRPGFLIVQRAWRDRDTLTLDLPMELEVKRWGTNRSASVHYGPLAFSVAIKERWQKYGTRNEAWPEWEVYAASPWNYGLALDSKDPIRGMKVQRSKGSLAKQPWTPESVPVAIKVRAQRIPEWQMDNRGMPARLQQSPVFSKKKAEEITLIPMGAGRLRISAFPVTSRSQGAPVWAPTEVQLQASHCFKHDSVEATVDGVVPNTPEQVQLPRFTWWDRRGSAEWIEYLFPEPRKISATEVTGSRTHTRAAGVRFLPHGN